MNIIKKIKEILNKPNIKKFPSTKFDEVCGIPIIYKGKLGRKMAIAIVEHVTNYPNLYKPLLEGIDCICIGERKNVFKNTLKIDDANKIQLQGKVDKIYLAQLHAIEQFKNAICFKYDNRINIQMLENMLSDYSCTKMVSEREKLNFISYILRL